MLLLLPALLCLPILTSCASLAKVIEPASRPFIQAAVDVAVATAVQQGASAAKIKSVAQQLLVADSGTQVALVAIETAVNAQIGQLHLPPADYAAVTLLTATLTGVIQLELQGTAAGAVTAETQVAVKQVLSDVILATAAYGQ